MSVGNGVVVGVVGVWGEGKIEDEKDAFERYWSIEGLYFSEQGPV